MGFTQLQVVVTALAQAINGVYKITHGSGLFAIFGLLNDLSALSGLSKTELLAELKAMVPAERQALEALFKSKLSIADAAFVAKLDSGIDLFDTAVNLGLEGYDVLVKGQAWVDSVKVFIG